MAETAARTQPPLALRRLPPFPAIAHRILALANRDDVNVRELGELVKMDPSFSAELLRFANSALFGSRREVTSLAHAIMVVGTDRIRTVATMVAVNRMVRASVNMAALRKVWIHSLVTAVVAEQAARACRLDPDDAYTAGLLHDLGMLGLMSVYSEQYSQMLGAGGGEVLDLMDAERHRFEIDHCAAGAHLAQSWDFPDKLAAVIATHHDEPVAAEVSLDNVIRVSWRLSDALGYAAIAPAKLASWEELVSMLPLDGSSWLLEQQAAAAEVSKRLASAPL